MCLQQQTHSRTTAIATPNWVAFDGTWTETRTTVQPITYPDPIDVAQPVLRGEDMGGGPVQYDYVVYPAFEVIDPFSIAVCYYNNSAGATKLRNDLIPLLAIECDNSAIHFDWCYNAAELLDGLRVGVWTSSSYWYNQMVRPTRRLLS